MYWIIAELVACVTIILAVQEGTGTKIFIVLVAQVLITIVWFLLDIIGEDLSDFVGDILDKLRIPRGWEAIFTLWPLILAELLVGAEIWAELGRGFFLVKAAVWLIPFGICQLVILPLGWVAMWLSKKGHCLLAPGIRRPGREMWSFLARVAIMALWTMLFWVLSGLWLFPNVF